MVELGITAGAVHAGPVIGKTYSQTSGSTRTAASRNVADDDSAGAIIRNPLRSDNSHFRPEQFSDGERQSSKMRADSELSRYSLTQIRAGGHEALRVQANAEPDRAVHLLEDPGR